MDALTLGLVGLSGAEERLMGTLFRLHGVDPSFIWTLSSTGPCDALLVDAGTDAAAGHALKGPQTRVMSLGPIGVGTSEHLMERPIRSDLLINWLKKLEVELLHGGHDAFASTALQSAAGSRLFDLDPGAPRSGTTEASSLLGSDHHNLLFKLRRWPAESLLNGDPARIRMATMLSRRALSVDELSLLSRQPPSACLVFVHLLRLEGLLVESRAESPATAGVAALEDTVEETEPARAEPRRGGFGLGLIGSIRRRFGLG